MTVEERLAKLEEEFGKVSKIVGDQNSYITKLELRKKQLDDEIKAAGKPAVQSTSQPAQPAQPAKPTAPINKPYEEYQRSQWRNAVVTNTLASITNINPAHKAILDEEVKLYCEQNMTDQTTTEKYVRSVFEMLYGRALTDPNHKIHTAEVVQQAAPAQPAQPTPATPQPEQPAQPQQPVPSADQFNQAFPPAVGQTGEQTFVPGAPVPEGEKKITNIADAMEILKQEL